MGSSFCGSLAIVSLLSFVPPCAAEEGSGIGTTAYSGHAGSAYERRRRLWMTYGGGPQPPPWHRPLSHPRPMRTAAAGALTFLALLAAQPLAGSSVAGWSAGSSAGWS